MALLLVVVLAADNTVGVGIEEAVGRTAIGNNGIAEHPGNYMRHTSGIERIAAVAAGIVVESILAVSFVVAVLDN